MKKFSIEISETAEQDLENIIKYIRYSLAGNITADKYKKLFIRKIQKLEYIAKSISVLDENLTGHKNIRKINVKNYIIFFNFDEINEKVCIIRMGHNFMDWKNI